MRILRSFIQFNDVQNLFMDLIFLLQDFILRFLISPIQLADGCMLQEFMILHIFLMIRNSFFSNQKSALHCFSSSIVISSSPYIFYIKSHSFQLYIRNHSNWSLLKGECKHMISTLSFASPWGEVNSVHSLASRDCSLLVSGKFIHFVQPTSFICSSSKVILENVTLSLFKSSLVVSLFSCLALEI